MDSLPKAHTKQNNLLDAIDVYSTTFYNWITKQKGGYTNEKNCQRLACSTFAIAVAHVVYWWE